jgi:acyl dehydratase
VDVFDEPRTSPEFTAERAITDQDIDRCAELTGDFGAHHIAGTGGRRIAQGLLTVAMAPLMRNDHDFRIRSMSLMFLAPVFAGDTVTARVRVDDEVEGVRQVRLSIRNQDGVEVVTGEGAGVFGVGTAAEGRST